MNRKHSFVFSLLGFVAVAFVFAPAVHSQQPFLRGDSNSDGLVSISDEVTIQRHLFAGGVLTGCYDAADTNDDGQVNLRDQIEIIKILVDPNFEGWSSVLPEPYPLIAVDPTEDDLTCQDYTVEPAQFSDDDVVILDEVVAMPGEQVEIPIFLTNTVDIDALQLVINYDPALLTPVEGRGAVELGSYFDRFEGDGVFNPIAMLNTHPEQGVFVVVLVGSLAYPGYEITPGFETHVGTMLATVSAEAPEGSMIPLTPNNGEENLGVGPHRMRNELTHRGQARYVSVIPRTVPGMIRIINPDFVIFLRGDTNSDGRIDISDSISTLNTLFLSGGAPACPDAADTNDDGSIDLSDAIAGLCYLFGATPTPDQVAVSSIGQCATDETEDDLDSCSYEHCPTP